MLLVLPTLVATTLAFAAEKTDYSAASFAAAQKAGKSILVEIQAPWCPTCRAQAPILSQLESAPKYVGLVVFHVDFDSQKDAVRGFGARMQSTLIAFKGQTETAGRSATPSRTPSRRCWRLHSERGPGIVGAGRLRSRVGGGLERAAAAPTLAEERDFQMRSRRSFAFWTLGLSVLLIASQAVGAEHREYAADAFDSAQRTGKSIIVVVRASWCPSCRVQELILSIIEYNPKYAGLVVFLVDFDAQKDALWQLDARAPSNSYCLQGRRRDRPIRRRNPSRFRPPRCWRRRFRGRHDPSADRARVRRGLSLHLVALRIAVGSDRVWNGGERAPFRPCRACRGGHAVVRHDRVVCRDDRPFARDRRRHDPDSPAQSCWSSPGWSWRCRAFRPGLRSREDR